MSIYTCTRRDHWKPTSDVRTLRRARCSMVTTSMAMKKHPDNKTNSDREIANMMRVNFVVLTYSFLAFMVNHGDHTIQCGMTSVALETMSG